MDDIDANITPRDGSNSIITPYGNTFNNSFAVLSVGKGLDPTPVE